MSNVHNFYVGDEKAICEEIKAWSAFVLEKKSPYFNNMPPCPYAKKAWSEDRVAIVFKYGGTQALTSCLSDFSDSLDLVIIVDQFFRRSAEVFHTELEAYNDGISQGIFGQKDLWLMGFHPDDDSNDLIDDGTFEPHINTPYAMIFLQKLSKVQEAAYTLRQLRYYDKYQEDYDVDEIFNQRETLYRRLKNGDETSEKSSSG